MEKDTFDMQNAQNGDFLAYEYGEENDGGIALLIFNRPFSRYEATYHYHALLDKNGKIYINGTCVYDPDQFRRCTEDEKSFLLDQLKKNYWHWNDTEKYVISVYKPIDSIDSPIDGVNLNLWARWQYDINVKKGWHKPEYSTNHFLMMIVTELSEIVEADRKEQHARKNFYHIEAIENDGVRNKNSRGETRLLYPRIQRMCGSVERRVLLSGFSKKTMCQVVYTNGLMR